MFMAPWAGMLLYISSPTHPEFDPETLWITLIDKKSDLNKRNEVINLL